MITEKDDQESKYCFLCQIPCSNICPHCRLVHYCNEEHFNLHRVTLKEEKVRIKCYHTYVKDHFIPKKMVKR